MPDQPHRDHYGDQAVALSPGRIGEMALQIEEIRGGRLRSTW
ncbi:hypothetical protein PAMC26510_19955 [Caballeronia sordidicola]|jgi:hypothetical protein|uniref:Uncharacterized protein n=1 Tax=Caballeronia sordidicola TaxID=196367 RepID=A0A242MP18_CABSO|nr:hypothetical protein PAMC26577_34130 [Caballeronia sordidicola]OTP73065.1 hypothetical protein PAMC26510_19955 [Caballeronia sordidicola]